MGQFCIESYKKNVWMHFSVGFAEFFTLQMGFFTQCCQVMSLFNVFIVLCFSLADRWTLDLLRVFHVAMEMIVKENQIFRFRTAAQI